MLPRKPLAVLLRPADGVGHFAISLLRVYVSLAIMAGHAAPKVLELCSGQGEFVGLVAQMGFPAPLFFAWAAAIAQLLGGMLLLTGFLTRLGASMVASTLAIGLAGVHWGDPFPVVEAGLSYLVALSVIAILGPDVASADRFLVDRWRLHVPTDAVAE